ncbi:DUF488 domain-containing protein [Sanguibacter sp. A247]|uniref:DUF488 domain-containing protein n=1 Tax=unclassified Sanguibacter TaxID=2645534 RepID=UPI003FD6C50C
MTAHEIRLARVYDDPVPSDGLRVLVDRIWPRGLSKERAALHTWARDVAPSTDLRTWYGHDPAKFEEFTRRYAAELADDDHATPLAELTALARSHDVVLLTASKALDISQAVVLADHLRRAVT